MTTDWELDELMRAAEREMHARELHHFEEEQRSERAEAVIAEALALVRPGSSVPLGVSEARHWDRLLGEVHRVLAAYDKEVTGA